MGVDINWSLGRGNDALGFFQAGSSLVGGAMDRRDERERNAQEMALKEREQAGRDADRADKQQGRERDEIGLMAKLLNHAKDETTYQQALGAGRQYGLPVDGAPANYDPAWVDQQRMIVQSFQKDGGQAVSAAGKIAMDEGLQPGTPEFSARVTQIYTAEQTKTIPYQAGGGVAGYNPVTGQTNSIIQPNPGDQPTGGAVDDDEWEVVPGNGTNGFPG